jgi:hypothetical protein
VVVTGLHCGTFMQQHLPFFGLHTLAKLPHCKFSPPHLSWLLAAPACGGIDSNISAADSVTISIRMIWLPLFGSQFAAQLDDLGAQARILSFQIGQGALLPRHTLQASTHMGASCAGEFA